MVRSSWGTFEGKRHLHQKGRGRRRTSKVSITMVRGFGIVGHKEQDEQQHSLNRYGVGIVCHHHVINHLPEDIEHIVHVGINRGPSGDKRGLNNTHIRDTTEETATRHKLPNNQMS